MFETSIWSCVRAKINEAPLSLNGETRGNTRSEQLLAASSCRYLDLVRREGRFKMVKWLAGDV